MIYDKVRFGLVGLGMGGETHARQISRLKDASLSAIYGRDPEKIRVFAERFNVPRTYGNFADMLSDKDIDVISVVTPNGLHAEFAIAAARAGKHVVVEKPLEITLSRAQQIIEACRENAVCLGVIFQMRFGRAAKKLKAAIDEGRLGQLLLADVVDKEFRLPSYYANDYWRGTKDLEGGGSVMTQSIHVIDLIQWLAGPVKSVFAKTRTSVHAIAVEDLSIGTLTFANGALGILESSTALYPSFKSRVEIHGSNGSAIINGEWDEIFFWDIKDEAEKVDTPAGFKFADHANPRLMPEDRQLLQFREIVEAVRAGRQPLVTGEEALRSLAIVSAIYKSATTGHEVEVSDVLARDSISIPW